MTITDNDPVLAIDFAELDFDEGHALTRIHICGVSFHCEVIEVVPCTDCCLVDGFPDDEKGTPISPRHWCDKNRALSDVWEDGIMDVYNAVGGSGPWETVAWEGREFILIITPYCD